MKAIFRKSDGLVTCTWEHDDDEQFLVPEGHGLVEIPESMEELDRRVGGLKDKGVLRFDGSRLTAHAPEPLPTLAGEIRAGRKAAGKRAEDPVSLGELEAAEAALEKRRQG